ncbi:MAG: ankyrin repeat domain-containing protein [Pyrinomonadaceae bacterium]
MNKGSEKEIFGKLVFSGAKDNVRELIDAGIDLDESNSSGMTPLFLAIEGDQPQILELLLKSGANPNKQSGIDGTTALHWAVDYSYDGMVQNNRDISYPEPLECIRILLKYGADENIKDNSGKIPLDYRTTEEIRNQFIK